MVQAIANWQEIENFARLLNDFSNTLRDNSTRMKGNFNQLGDTWRDAQHQKFVEDFDTIMKSIDYFIMACDSSHVPHLRKLAEQLKMYTDISIGGY